MKRENEGAVTDEAAVMLRPYTVTARNISWPTPWPDRAHKCREQADRVIVIVDGAVLVRRARALPRLTHEGRVLPAPKGRDAFRDAECARIFLRHTDRTVYALALVTPYDPATETYHGSTEVYYGQASGYGYDRTAAALAGIPVGVARGTDGRMHRAILTDHCGLDGVAHPWGREVGRAITVHENDRLPGDLFVV